MNYWLLKSEPEVYSYDNLVRDKKAVWDGIRNYQARNNLKAMKKGDVAFFSHSGDRNIVGTVKILKEWYSEPGNPDWAVVEIAPNQKLKNAVGLAQIKAEKRLQNMVLVKVSRLSVQPVKADEYETILSISELK